MKYRNGFVSNSSSTSFIVGLKEKESEPCPHCGRSDPDFIDAYIERGDVHDTELSIDGRLSSVIKELQEEIEGYKEEIKDYQKFRPTDTTGFGKVTYADMVDWAKTNISDTETLIEKIKEVQDEGYIVHQFDISYHDGPARNKLQELVKIGSAVIITERD